MAANLAEPMLDDDDDSTLDWLLLDLTSCDYNTTNINKTKMNNSILDETNLKLTPHRGLRYLLALALIAGLTGTLILLLLL